MWKDLPNFFFSALAAFIVSLKYTNGSPPVIPAPFAFESMASFIISEVDLQGRSFAHICVEFFLPSDKEQYQHFREHFPPMNKTSFCPFRQNLQPLQMELFL